jgi:hypothetical protein
MGMDPLSFNFSQPTLFDFNEPSSGAMELFPTVWGAVEDLVSPEIATRRAGLETLVEMGAPRLSPLIAYLLATRLTDPDLDLRTCVVQVLSEVLEPDEQGHSAPEAVSRVLRAYLSKIRVRPIYALLEVVEADASMDRPIARLLNCCPYGGTHLATILTERKLEVRIRQKAAHMVGLVGFLDTLPTLERLATRLQARLNGQQSMPFAPVDVPDESALLPDVQSALVLLKAI